MAIGKISTDASRGPSAIAELLVDRVIRNIKGGRLGGHGVDKNT